MFSPCFAFPSTAPAASTDRSGGHESLSKMQWSPPSCPRRPDRVPCFVVGKIELLALNDAFYPTYSRKRSKDGLIGIHRPASLLLPNGPTRLDVTDRPNQPHDATPPSLVTDVIEPPLGRLRRVLRSRSRSKCMCRPAARPRSAPGAAALHLVSGIYGCLEFKDCESGFKLLC
jgi:hypothetical protein